ARRHVGHRGDRALRLAQPRDTLRNLLDMAALQHALADRNRDVVRVERALYREQPVVLLVALADHGRLGAGAVELLAYLYLDERALLLDHDDELEPFGELFQFAARQRPGAGDLVDLNAEVVAAHLVNAELVEGLAHVEIALADRDDADLRVASARDHHAVEL